MKTAYDLKHVKHVSAIALVKDGKPAGKIVANWSDNPNGSVCTATVQLWAYHKKEHEQNWFTGTGRAGGYGYDKLSSAIYEALRSMRAWPSEELHNLTTEIQVSPGAGNQSHAFESAGYQYIEVC